MEHLRAEVEVIQNPERGVLLFNAALKNIADSHGDRVAEVGKCVSEHALRELVLGNFRLKSGAMGAAVKKHVSASSYSQSGTVEHLTTIDQAHPTDQMYRLLWLEIYEQIKRSNCTFGTLSPAIAGTTLTELSETPGRQTRQDYRGVMDQLLATCPRTPPTRPD